VDNSGAFGWVLLGLAAFLSVAVYRLWRDGASPRWAVGLAGALVVAMIALVIDVWAAS
jgi:hypothetical protein